MIELSREKLKERQLEDKIKLLHMQGAEATKMLAKEGPFDAASVVFVLHHARKHLEDILETLHKVLKQHGKVFVLDWHPPSERR
jgi:ubiquinone/menaquinone biosynthesis C-methylase UbiE